MRLGQDYRKMGRYDDAVAQLTQAVQLDKSYSDAYLELGKTYADMKETDKANEQLSILISVQSTPSLNLLPSLNRLSSPNLQNFRIT